MTLRRWNGTLVTTTFGSKSNSRLVNSGVWERVLPARLDHELGEDDRHHERHAGRHFGGGDVDERVTEL